MNILPDIKTILTTAGMTAAEIKLAKVPDAPDTVVVISDTGGIEPNANDTSVTERQNKTFQVYVRSADYNTAIARCEAVRSALVNQINRTVGATHFENILVTSEFQSIGNDEVNRWEFTGNFKSKVRSA